MPTEAMKAVMVARNQEKARRWLHQSERFEAGGAAPEAMLDSLTLKITERVRQEVEALGPAQQRDVAEKLDDYMHENLRQTHTCQVCFELMQPPHRSPTMLFPCGHTFCKECVRLHRSRSGPAAKACPVCRTVIETVAENRALKELIEKFVGEKRELERGARGSPDLLLATGPRADAAAGGGAAANSGGNRYAAEHAAAEMRRDILARELADTERALVAADRRLGGIGLATDHLAAERADVCRRLRALEAERDLVDEHIAAQRRKEAQLDDERREARGKIAILRETIAGLEAQMAKSQALAEGLEAAPR